MNPIIVTGAPYSGTSIIARLLQTKLDVMMDEGPIRKDKNKPQGYYEDHRLQKINEIAYRYRLKRLGTNNKQVPIQWAAQFASWLVERNNKYKTWGFKDPASVGLIPAMHKFFDTPIWIVCHRRDSQVIKSQIKKSNYPVKVAKQGLKAYQDIIKRELHDKCHYIDLSERKEEAQLFENLQGILNGRI